MGFADMIARGEIPIKELDDCVDTIKRNGDVLLRLVDDILDLSCIEVKGFALEESSVSISDIFKDVESSFAVRKQKKGVKLSFSYIGLNINQRYLVDQIRFKQVLLNIIDNAIKFTKKGAVKVGVTVFKSPDEGEFDRIVIRVSDQGIGIEKMNIRKLFKPFTQEDSLTKCEYGGNGLGLAISKGIIHAMGGEIKLRSTRKFFGSTFEINAPLRKSGISAKSLSIKSIFRAGFLKGKKILVIDDSLDNLFLIEVYLRRSGAELSFFTNGFDAISACENGQFDLILMDIRMPGLDGIETTKRMRAIKVGAPIIALTALASHVDESSLIASGCNKVLQKPVNKDALLQVINRSLY